MSINLDNFPTFNEEHFHDWVNQLTPIEEYKGYRLKRDDQFNLGGISGGKVRQCAKLVYDNLQHIKDSNFLPSEFGLQYKANDKLDLGLLISKSMRFFPWSAY